MRTTIFLLLILILSSCKEKADPLLTAYDQVYADILARNYHAVTQQVDHRSQAYIDDIADVDHHNIDSIIVIGERYNVPYLTTEFMAYHSEELATGSVDSLLYEYLGSQDISLFSFKNAYYVEKGKIKRASDYYIPIIKEEMTQSYRKWTRWTGSEAEGYRLDLRYILELAESDKKKKYELLRKRRKDLDGREAYLRDFYWKNSGPESLDFKEEMRDDHKMQREGRAAIVKSYSDRGLMDR